MGKIQKRFANHFHRFANESNSSQEGEQFQHEGPAGEHADYTRVLEFVVKKLFSEDPVAYLDYLVEGSEVEMQEMKKQLALSMPSGDYYPSSPRSAISPPQSPSHQDAIVPPPPPVSPSSNHASSPRHQVAHIDLIRTSSGEFTFGIQLAALLYLSSMSPETTTQNQKQTK